MERHMLNGLYFERLWSPPRYGWCTRSTRELLVAGHQDDRSRDTNDRAIADAVVEMERPCEGIVDQSRRFLPDIGNAQDASPIVDDETKAHASRAQDVDAIDGEQPPRVERWPEEMRVKAV